MRVVDVTEGQAFSLEPGQAVLLRQAVSRLQAQLRPRFAVLHEDAGQFRLHNIVGTVELGAGSLIQVAPKVHGGGDWGAAVVSLLTGEERIAPGGERPAGVSGVHTRLVDAIAEAYASRLERAYRQDGPLLTMERQQFVSTSLSGKLHASQWARTAAWRPHLFPVSRTVISHENPYSRLLLEVASALQGVASAKTRLRLNAVARDLSLGSVASGRGSLPTVRQLPSQWAAYKPAWSLAIAIVTRTSLFGPSGRHTGLSLVVEAWPLLETMLSRTLRDIAARGRSLGRTFHHESQGEVPLLTPTDANDGGSFKPKPDGRLYEDGKLLACFEAKYAALDGMPARDHIYQAVATASACRAPVVVLVYPGRHEPRVWRLNQPKGGPQHLVALGLDLFQWPQLPAQERGTSLLDLLDGLANRLHLPPVVAA
jgi:hypothetical protein